MTPWPGAGEKQLPLLVASYQLRSHLGLDREAKGNPHCKNGELWANSLGGYKRHRCYSFFTSGLVQGSVQTWTKSQEPLVGKPLRQNTFL